jgi:acyl-CoA synthetase (NDP forming)
MSIETALLRLCTQALTEGRSTLLEPELYEALAEGGLSVPRFTTAAPDRGLEAPFEPIPSAQVVLKVVSPLIAHKSDLGGVAVVPNSAEAINQGIRRMMTLVRQRGGDRLADSVSRILVSEHIECQPQLGSQLFAGLRWTADMGPVVTLGFGGLEAEELNEHFAQGQSVVLFSPLMLSAAEGLEKFSRSFAYRKLAGKTREKRRLLDDGQLLAVIDFFSRVATRFSNQADTGFVIQDFEINPFFVVNGACVAVDAFLRFSKGCVQEPAADLPRLRRLLTPETVGLVGVSPTHVNVGRVILRNLVREGFPLDKVRVIRDGAEGIDSVACCPSLEALPWTVDMLLVAVGADQVPGIVQEVFASKKAETLVVIAGGMGETEDGREQAQATQKLLHDARGRGDWTPVIVGPNCLGIRSKPGRYDTLFIPQNKLPPPEGPFSNCALICQSGAFMITRMNGLGFLDPTYAISTGNQMDLGVADFFEAVIENDRVEVVALYIEGFKALDGLRLARTVERARRMGKDVLVYKAGRTGAGKTATTSHTASIAGDYISCAEILEDAGAFIANGFRELKACLAVASLLKHKPFSGRGLGCLSNAGFETVGFADNVREDWGFSLAELVPATRDRLRGTLDRARLRSLINVRNPLDLTPMAPDRVFAECAAAMLDDPKVDTAILGIVPLSPALKTLAPGVDPAGRDDVEAPDSIVNLLGELAAKTSKPFVTVVDGGPGYDVLDHHLHQRGIPCFRTADFSMRAYQKFVRYKTGGAARNRKA